MTQHCRANSYVWPAEHLSMGTHAGTNRSPIPGPGTERGYRISTYWVCGPSRWLWPWDRAKLSAALLDPCRLHTAWLPGTNPLSVSHGPWRDMTCQDLTRPRAGVASWWSVSQSVRHLQLTGPFQDYILKTPWNQRIDSINDKKTIFFFSSPPSLSAQWEWDVYCTYRNVCSVGFKT